MLLCVHEQEQRAHQASLRAEQVLHASYGPTRKAERKAKEATHRGEALKWRIEGGGIRLHFLPTTGRARRRQSEIRI
jgi:hypothetical protein